MGVRKNSDEWPEVVRKFHQAHKFVKKNIKWEVKQKVQYNMKKCTIVYLDHIKIYYNLQEFKRELKVKEIFN